MFQYYRFITKTGRILACCSLFLLSDLAHASPWSIYLGGGGLTIRPEDSRRTALGQDRFYYFLDRMERMNTSPGDRTLNYLILGSTDLSPPPIQPGSGSLQIRYSETGDPWMFRIGYRGVRGQIPCRECSELNGFPRWHILDQFQQGNRDATFLLYASEFARSQGGFRVSMDLLEFGWTYHFKKNAGPDPYLGLMGRIGTCRLEQYGSGSCQAGFAGVHAELRFRTSNRTFLEPEAEYGVGRPTALGQVSSTGLNLGLSWML